MWPKRKKKKQLLVFINTLGTWLRFIPELNDKSFSEVAGEYFGNNNINSATCNRQRTVLLVTTIIVTHNSLLSLTINSPNLNRILIQGIKNFKRTNSSWKHGLLGHINSNSRKTNAKIYSRLCIWDKWFKNNFYYNLYDGQSDEYKFHKSRSSLLSTKK